MVTSDACSVPASETPDPSFDSASILVPSSGRARRSGSLFRGPADLRPGNEQWDTRRVDTVTGMLSEEGQSALIDAHHQPEASPLAEVLADPGSAATAGERTGDCGGWHQKGGSPEGRSRPAHISVIEEPLAWRSDTLTGAIVGVPALPSYRRPCTTGTLERAGSPRPRQAFSWPASHLRPFPQADPRLVTGRPPGWWRSSDPGGPGVRVPRWQMWPDQRFAVDVTGWGDTAPSVTERHPVGVGL